MNNRLLIDNSKLDKILISKGMNKAMLANAAGITSNYLYRITGGYRSPSNVVAKKIADVLDVDVLDIFF